MPIFWKEIIIYATIVVAEPDANSVNHLLSLNFPDKKDFLVSYTGPVALGKEGQTVHLLLEEVSCQEKMGCYEDPYRGPMGYRAWICDTEKVTNLGD